MAITAREFVGNFSSHGFCFEEKLCFLAKFLSKRWRHFLDFPDEPIVVDDGVVLDVVDFQKFLKRESDLLIRRKLSLFSQLHI